MITATALAYYGICAILIVGLVWILTKCPILPKDESAYFLDDEDL